MDPSSEFAVSVAVGAAHVLDSLARTTRCPIAAAVLSLPILVAYLAAVTLAFAVREVADCYARAVAQEAGAAILGWVTDLVVRIVVHALLLGAFAVAWALLQSACTGGTLEGSGPTFL